MSPVRRTSSRRPDRPGKKAKLQRAVRIVVRRRVARPRAPDAASKTRWLRQVLGETFGMDPEDATVISRLVVGRFENRDEVDDDTLTPDVRSIFYTLETKRILTFRRIEYKGDEGQTRRGFLWRFHVDRPVASAHDAATVNGGNLYEDLPETVWRRAAT